MGLSSKLWLAYSMLSFVRGAVTALMGSVLPPPLGHNSTCQRQSEDLNLSLTVTLFPAAVEATLKTAAVTKSRGH